MSTEDDVREQLMRLGAGFRATQALYVAAKLGLGDRLIDGPKDAETLAREVGAKPDPLFRVLRALAAHGVFSIDGAGRFGLTEMGRLLRTDLEGSVVPFAIFQGEESYRAFGELLYSVRTGEPGFDHVFGSPIFDYIGEHPELGSTFNRAMASAVQALGDPFTAFDFSSHHTVVDVGGGNGTLISRILRSNPALRGILFDLPSGTARATEVLGAAGVADRCEVRNGSMFETVPSGGDVYVLSRILHDWPDEAARTILGNCRRGMRPGATLLLVEGVLSEGVVPVSRAHLDLTMLVMQGGRERTEREWRALLSSTGFAFERVLSRGRTQDLFEARAV